MLLAFFAYHRLIFLQHANVSKHFRQTFLHAFVPLYHLCQGRLLSVVQHLVDAVSQHLSVDVIRIVEFTNTLQISQTQSGYVRLILIHSFFTGVRVRGRSSGRLMSMVSYSSEASGFSFRLLASMSSFFISLITCFVASAFICPFWRMIRLSFSLMRSLVFATFSPASNRCFSFP